MGDAPKDSCGACMERKCGYENQIRELHRNTTDTTDANNNSGGGWSFWKSPSQDDCGCGGGGETKPPPKQDDCMSKQDNCGSKQDGCVGGGQGQGQGQCGNDDKCFKPPSGKCPPMPSTNVPAICLPAWFTCPPQITVPPYPAPPGVEIKPISEGGRGSKCEGGRCNKCGQNRPESGPPKVSGNCPMLKPKCATATTKAASEVASEASKKKDGILKRIASALGLGGKKKEESK